MVGAHALALQGHIRATNDLDAWIRPTLENAHRSKGVNPMKRDDLPLLVIQAQGTVEMPPDTVVVTWKFDARHADGAQAQRETDRQCQGLLDRLATIGFVLEDLRLHKESLEQLTEFDLERRTTVFLGFKSSRTWVLRFPVAANRLGALLGCLQGSGVPCTITHELTNREAMEDQSIRVAIAKARRQAGVMSESAGIRLGRIVSITRGELRIQHDVYQWEAMSLEESPAAAPPPPKDIHGSETVTISWEIV